MIVLSWKHRKRQIVWTRKRREIEKNEPNKTKWEKKIVKFLIDFVLSSSKHQNKDRHSEIEKANENRNRENGKMMREKWMKKED